MTKTELEKQLHDLEQETEKKRKAILIEYANSNSTVKPGEIVRDHIGSVLVQKIGVYADRNNAQCMYTGIELKKDLTPVKKGTTRTVFQCNLT